VKYWAIAFLILGILGMAVYLIMNGHPWWGAFFVLIAASVRDTESKTAAETAAMLNSRKETK
jgi:hypothetical protein